MIMKVVTPSMEFTEKMFSSFQDKKTTKKRQRSLNKRLDISQWNRHHHHRQKQACRVKNWARHSRLRWSFEKRMTSSRQKKTTLKMTCCESGVTHSSSSFPSVLRTFLGVLVKKRKESWRPSSSPSHREDSHFFLSSSGKGIDTEYSDTVFMVCLLFLFLRNTSLFLFPSSWWSLLQLMIPSTSFLSETASNTLFSIHCHHHLPFLLHVSNRVILSFKASSSWKESKNDKQNSFWDADKGGGSVSTTIQSLQT